MFSPARFKLIEAGRRSGKTELAKRDEVATWAEAAWMTGRHDWRGQFYCPTRDQVKAIYWEDLNERVPDELVARRNVAELTIRHIHGPTIALIGMDKPARADGPPIDSAKVDEFANMKPGVWGMHIRPSLDTDGRPGKAWIYGVTRQSRQFEELADYAKSGLDKDWDYFWWPSSSVLSEEAIAAAKRELDSRTFEQEYGGKRVPMSGRAYYEFSRIDHVRDSLPYNPDAPLILCLDFNRAPGSGVVCQEAIDPALGECTYVIGEIHIPYDSNTPLVCRTFKSIWGEHRGPVHYYGDPTGGNKGTAKQDNSSDWAQVEDELRPHFGSRLHDHHHRKTRPERGRVNALNKRLRNAAGDIHMRIDGKKAPSVVRDLDHMLVKEGTDGELWKEHDQSIGHWADGLGYYCEERHPLYEHMFTQESI
jgi:hypothetical protein